MTTASRNRVSDFPAPLSDPNLSRSWSKQYAHTDISEEAVADEFALGIARDTSRGPLMSSASSAISFEGVEEPHDSSSSTTNTMLATPQLPPGFWSSQNSTMPLMGLTPSSSPGYSGKVNLSTSAPAIGVPLSGGVNLTQYNPSIWGPRKDFSLHSPPFFAKNGSTNSPNSHSSPNAAKGPVAVTVPSVAQSAAIKTNNGSSGSSVATPVSSSAPTKTPVSLVPTVSTVSSVPTVPSVSGSNGHSTFYPATPWGVEVQAQSVPLRSTVSMRSPVSPPNSNIYNVRKAGGSSSSPQSSSPTNQSTSGVSRQFQRNVQQHNQFPKSGSSGSTATHSQHVSNYSTNNESSGSNRSVKKGGRPSTNTDLYKTELCASFMSTGGNCPYGEKCQFAHGPQELKTVDRPPKWRSKPCQNWVRTGTCSYNERCCFRHDVPVDQQQEK